MKSKEEQHILLTTTWNIIFLTTIKNHSQILRYLL